MLVMRSAEEGSVSVLLMSATFKGEETTTYVHEIEDGILSIAPNAFCVMIAKPNPGVPRIVGGLIMQSSLKRENPTFQDAVESMIALSPPLRQWAVKPKRMLPANLHVPGNEPLSEQECARILTSQFFSLGNKAGHA